MSSLAILTVITAVISYEHAYEVFRAARNTGLLAILGPLVPDMVIAVCSMALLAAARQGDERPWVAILALTGFIGVTVALNAAAGLRYGRGSALLAILAPVGYLTGLHILAGMLRRGRGLPGSKEIPVTCGHKVAMNLDEAIKAASPFLSQNELAANFTVSRATVRRRTGRLASSGRKASRNAVPAAAETVVTPATATPPGPSAAVAGQATAAARQPATAARSAANGAGR